MPRMIRCCRLLLLLASLLCSAILFAGDTVPAIAWHRALGAPLANPGTKKPEISVIDDGYWQGAPVGGFGAGTFSRSYRGNFERWHVKAGVHKYQNVPADQFAVFAQPEGGQAVAMALSTHKPEDGSLSTWNWSYPAGDGEYAALYPKSWFVYSTQQLPVKLTLEQFSPVLPNNYKESSYPVAVYNWYASNPSQQAVTVSLLFSWTNMVGWFRDSTQGFAAALNTQNINHFKKEITSAGEMDGIVFDRIRNAPVSDEWDGQFAIATEGGKGAEVTYLTTYRPADGGAEVWTTFSKDGRLPNVDAGLASSGDVFAGAIAVRFTLRPGEKRVVPMALSWDLPYAQFGNGRKWARHYTRYFDRSGTNAWKLAHTALQQGPQWSQAIDAWQKPYVEDASKPGWYRGMLFNELYDLADGGTFWGHEANSTKDSPDSFSYLECFDYAYYGTLDVRFYGSFPLLRFWPDLEKQEMREYADTLPMSMPQKYVWAWRSKKEGRLISMQRKAAWSAPHDLGSPSEDPFVLPNQYNYQDISSWKDLNSKYVLMVWRDYVMTGGKDRAFLQYNYNAVKHAMEYLNQYDKNGDGLLENDGFPDQTYDTWSARGESSYSGSLQLAALRATEEMAKIVGDTATAGSTAAQFKRAQAAFIKKLWNGKYFNYDVGSPYRDSIMAEQLAGQWYATMTGLGDLVPDEMRRSAFKTIYEYNVMKLHDGDMGALNGIGADGSILTENEQSQEVWTGVTFAVASTMLQEGLHDEAYTTAKGIYDVVYEEKGYWFRTPEAWDSRGLFRASMYMRPGAIWAMETKPVH